MIFLGGAYRLHRPEDRARFTVLAESAFPAFRGRIECFGTDWLGRQFASDRSRRIHGLDAVLMLEPGTGEALEMPVSVSEFHTNELLEQAEAAVAVSFFREWLANGGEAPGYNQCVGYKRPLYLGGADGLENLELCDTEIYWTIAAQLLESVRDLPPGTRIASISIR